MRVMNVRDECFLFSFLAPRLALGRVVKVLHVGALRLAPIILLLKRPSNIVWIVAMLRAVVPVQSQSNTPMIASRKVLAQDQSKSHSAKA